MIMRRAAFESSLNLVISIVIIGFIVSIGYFEINSFLENRDRQLFMGEVLEVQNNIEYLIESNARGSFIQVNVRIPANQTLIFDNMSNSLVLEGFINENISLNVDVTNYLELINQGDYKVTLCYECSASKDYLVNIR